MLMHMRVLSIHPSIHRDCLGRGVPVLVRSGEGHSYNVARCCCLSTLTPAFPPPPFTSGRQEHRLRHLLAGTHIHTHPHPPPLGPHRCFHATCVASDSHTHVHTRSHTTEPADPCVVGPCGRGALEQPDPVRGDDRLLPLPGLGLLTQVPTSACLILACCVRMYVCLCARMYTCMNVLGGCALCSPLGAPLHYVSCARVSCVCVACVFAQGVPERHARLVGAEEHQGGLQRQVRHHHITTCHDHSTTTSPSHHHHHHPPPTSDHAYVPCVRASPPHRRDVVQDAYHNFMPTYQDYVLQRGSEGAGRKTFRCVWVLCVCLWVGLVCVCAGSCDDGSGSHDV
jgi:hypothetical protein